ncbi:MAG: hypothetical protein HOB40_08505 [Candidatus Marinimicrobia bacterium]|nr:hypothetical protein [Candidatus Neomarinimicrobiota bacterium]MBT3839119.1 hypothetical protein [Candidatus Neomarinimicrobiota bacterium]MBT3998959.1 hypothetical protein [Candidatus Neomarinimicrobiota bacterium]MBT4579084.1 hypothetical protein [Candidatus Neomarinimicrobiota bacterium]MBT4958029.1 hypothetical protein [Candidatus Neomarinimicrobiota bacterium]
MPVILFILLLMVDRDNSMHVIGFISLLLIYTAILIMRILYAKERWHEEFNGENLGQNTSIQKMSDLKDKLEEENEIDSRS